MMKVAETTDSLLNEHRENCQIGLSYIKRTALRHKLQPFVKLRTQIFFNTLYQHGQNTVFRTKIFLLFYQCHSVVLNLCLNLEVFYINICGFCNDADRYTITHNAYVGYMYAVAFACSIGNLNIQTQYTFPIVYTYQIRLM